MLSLIWFRSKVLATLKNELHYDAAVPGFQQQAFNEITRNVKSEKGNQYDAAIAFLLVQLNVLVENSKLEQDMERKKQTVLFVEDKLNSIQRIYSFSTGLCNDWIAEITKSEAYQNLKSALNITTGAKNA